LCCEKKTNKHKTNTKTTVGRNKKRKKQKKTECKLINAMKQPPTSKFKMKQGKIKSQFSQHILYAFFVILGWSCFIVVISTSIIANDERIKIDRAEIEEGNIVNLVKVENEEKGENRGMMRGMDLSSYSNNNSLSGISIEQENKNRKKRDTLVEVVKADNNEALNMNDSKQDVKVVTDVSAISNNQSVDKSIPVVDVDVNVDVNVKVNVDVDVDEETKSNKDKAVTEKLMPLLEISNVEVLTDEPNEGTIPTPKAHIAENNESLSKMSIPVNDQNTEITLNTNTTNAATSHKKVSIFMNTWINPNTTNVANKIVYDQLELLDIQPLLANATLYYSHFGDLGKWPINACQAKRPCVKLTAQEEGDESITMQYLYEHCVANPDERVLYIHNKGSYTRNPNNRVLRNVLMKAVTSRECLEMPTSCSACSSQFPGYPGHYPGNMWVADCNYIVKLIPPNKFGEAKEQLMNRLNSLTRRIEDTDIFEARLDDGLGIRFHNNTKWMIDRPSWFGTERFAIEQWLGSHPDLQPCEVFSPKDGIPSVAYANFKRMKLYAEGLTPKLRSGPGLPFTKFWTQKIRINPWYRANGRLFEYKALYSKVPDESSWFYSFWEGVPRVK
jgi:hypothetical protein